ncbi:four helix bundle protein [Candidatus Oleimmundimicrobium sp.]|uniref:four helix bundle protein n=1 Tax=Candidatus Oleimmundimicrobium sp. TaxID=3060597 RepID=UPI0027271BCD|nr:four helix bundle protein [Candidatus Oleimmundimicrobium sp.]MDO8885535.1 four helix bundle protein [Candidatus Oleimmundimicrobium sp.]
MEYKSFEDLEVYKVVREFVKKIYKLVKELPDFEKYNLANQMRRAAAPLTSCVAEGHGRFYYQENIQFLRQSRGSLEELIDDLNVCIDENYAELNRLNKLKKEGYDILKKLNGYIKYLCKCKEVTEEQQQEELII